MNLKSTIVFFTSVAICFQLSAQCNYINKQYNVSKESNVLFGNDISYDGVATDLFLNIFKPVNDFNTKRPILLLIHGGGFTGGTKEEMDSMCHWYAQRGYVTATMSYRLGFYGPSFLSSPFAFDSAEVIRAAFRGVQDAHGALRFMEGRAAIDSTDVNLAFVGGASAGAITALHLTYADKAWESPPAVDSISNVINSFVNKQRPSMGAITGSLNMNGQSSQVQAVVSFYGALLDTTLVESATDVPMFAYHQTLDPVVGCGYKKGLWNMPLNVGANYPHLFGTCVMEPRFQNLGYTPNHFQDYIYTGNTHGVHDTPLIDGLIAVFLNDRICEVIASDVGESGSDVSFNVYPNPANDFIRIGKSNYAGATKITLTNGYGAIAYTAIVRNLENEFEINIQNLASGIYTLQLLTNGLIQSKKVVIVH
nr:carboxylesterase family protein [Bacteroidota bacterium]